MHSEALGRVRRGRHRKDSMATIHNIDFVTSVDHLKNLLPPGPAEVAFVGRSNAGKSSAINAMANRRRLAYVSKTPGRTQLINFFLWGGHGHLVDLPGYGYAKVPGEMRKGWDQLIGGYLAQRETLRGLVVIMDARHPMTPLDEELLEWFAPRQLPVHVLLSKADKLSRGEASQTLLKVRRALAERPISSSAQLFSSLNRQGVDEAIDRITEMLLEAPLEAGAPPAESSVPPEHSD